MSRLPSRRHVAALTLGLVLLAPWAAMAQPAGIPSNARASLAAPADLLIRAWSALSGLWASPSIALPSPAPGVEPRHPGHPIGAARLKGGCHLDPDGRCVN